MTLYIWEKCLSKKQRAFTDPSFAPYHHLFFSQADNFCDFLFASMDNKNISYNQRGGQSSLSTWVEDQ